MRVVHSLKRVNIDLLRNLIVIVEMGSLNRAAEKLRLSQSTLTRQIQLLEHEIDGRVLERTSSGVIPTATGQELLNGVSPLLERFDAVLQNVRAFARGQRDVLRIGYVASAAVHYLNRALGVLRQKNQEIKVQLFDLSPGEQIALLRQSDLDVALLISAGAFFSREFYVRKLTSIGSVVAMAECDPLAQRTELNCADLKGRLLIGAFDSDMPGYNLWVTQLCRKAGFRSHFALEAESLSHSLSSVVTENALTLQPEYMEQSSVPGVVFRKLNDPTAQWEISVAWQRGKMADPVKCLLDALFTQ